eukprot:TRINITY_DN6489_c0_g2_i1.p1 TRINITY_DN6489_c0_g2~~TRINITY_DN6489_c0_g2_i1.p1  ORF type:complete len:289 (-),score=26.66 TRINITY_DN6489_c0_g2_i1:59-925(-)
MRKRPSSPPAATALSRNANVSSSRPPPSKPSSRAAPSKPTVRSTPLRRKSALPPDVSRSKSNASPSAVPLTDHVRDMLVELGLPLAAASEYAPGLTDYGCDSNELLRELTVEDMQTLGIKPMHVRKLRSSIVPFQEQMGSGEVSARLTYSPEDQIGIGGSGSVHGGVWRGRDPSGETAAVKKVPKAFSTGNERREVEVLTLLSHPHIVQYLGYEEDREWCYIVLERCECSLNEGLGQLADVFEACRQLASAVSFVHSHGVAHRECVVHPCCRAMPDVMRTCRCVVLCL